MEELTVTIGNTEVTAEPVSGKLEDGELLVESFEWEINGSVHAAIDEPTIWNEESLQEQIKAEWDNSESWPDTCDEEWEDTRNANPDTITWEILEFIYKTQPVTSTCVDDSLELDGSASAYISKMKDNNLAACVGHEDGAQVVCLTHVGIKELLTADANCISVATDTGLDKLMQSDEIDGINPDKEQTEISDQL